MCDASVHDTAHDAAHDTSVIRKQNLLLEFCADPKSRDELQAYIDVSSRSHFSKYYLKPLLSSGKLEMMFHLHADYKYPVVSDNANNKTSSAEENSAFLIHVTASVIW